MRGISEIALTLSLHVVLAYVTELGRMDDWTSWSAVESQSHVPMTSPTTRIIAVSVRTSDVGLTSDQRTGTAGKTRGRQWQSPLSTCQETIMSQLPFTTSRRTMTVQCAPCGSSSTNEGLLGSDSGVFCGRFLLVILTYICYALWCKILFGQTRSK